MVQGCRGQVMLNFFYVIDDKQIVHKNILDLVTVSTELLL